MIEDKCDRCNYIILCIWMYVYRENYENKDIYREKDELV